MSYNGKQTSDETGQKLYISKNLIDKIFLNNHSTTLINKSTQTITWKTNVTMDVEENRAVPLSATVISISTAAFVNLEKGYLSILVTNQSNTYNKD